MTWHHVIQVQLGLKKKRVVKENAIAAWIGSTGLPDTTVEDKDFILMLETFDKRLTMQKRTKVNFCLTGCTMTKS